ncbi:phage tail assembly protein [Rhizobium laguerreae]|uniref:phage tail assembly protein n=1 Tax=Rhizobium laguerreae TaxID=1076926 RepID=UPI001C8FCCDC|nr:phage tail assembly protein [Rhizobium laguerreae]MBY3312228.1 phage tail assembly protein [Rhizobium laguerreae]
METPADRSVKLQAPVRVDGAMVSELTLSVADEGVGDRLRSLRLIPGQAMTTGDWLAVLAEMTGLPRSAVQALCRRDLMAAVEAALPMLPAVFDQTGAPQ